jgi:hypothetical protein
LLDRFPGRFLEEIDGIDYARHERAWRAERIQTIEARRAADLSLGSLSDEEKAGVVQHDRWLRETEDG